MKKGIVMKKKLQIAAGFAFAVTSLAAQFAQAQEAASPVSYNVSLTSDYRYRGISQTRLDPALQGGADYADAATGLYAGTWLSTIKWTHDLGGDGHVEWDIYGGKKGQITPDISYDVGGLYYFYPSNGLNPNANTFELYGQLGYGPAYVKYSHSTTNLFGTADSRGSGYLDVGANIDLSQGYVLNLHAGHQKVNHNSVFSYSDYKLGVTKDLGVCSVSLAYVKANTEAYLSPAGRNLGKAAAVLSVSKTF
jgi:uncharacterized protein (TIGR02001 family)